MSEPGSGPNSPKGDLSPEELAEFKRRTADLGARIDRTQAEKQAELEAQQDKANHAKGMAYGLRMSTELVAAILVGGFIGYMLDQWLGTTPWLFLVFFVLGFSAGILNVTRAFQRMQGEIAKETGGNIGKSVPDDDD
jgi:ATP synthase protein I